MDIGGPSVCVCGRSFSKLSAFTNHKRTCQSSKKRLASALDKAKQLWQGSKRRRIQTDTPEVPTAPGLVLESSLATAEEIPNDFADVHQADAEDTDTTMMERRPWTRRLNRRLPLRFRDLLPLPPPPLPPPPLAQNIASTGDHSSPTITSGRTSPLHSGFDSLRRQLRQTFTTERNVFGLSRRYHALELPSHDPEEYSQLDELSDIPPPSSSSILDPPSFYPYPNSSSFRLGDWYWNGGIQKSQSSFKELVHIVGDPEFHPEDIRDTNWNDINNTLGNDKGDEWLDEDAGWLHTPVTISVPYHPRRGVLADPHAGPQDYTVADFYHRNLISVIRERLSESTDNRHFHYEPYELNWQPEGMQRSVRVHGELYTSPAFIDAHRDLQDSPAEPGCELPRVVVGLMFSSDVTHLTSFGDAKLWPLYMFFGNESKYRRCKPSCNVCHHVAYFQSLPDAFKDFAATQTAGGKAPSDPYMTHCARELMHAQWAILLDDEFVEAWQHGIVVTCCDGIKRRFYPRIFSYSADYPEKILLASIRNLGQCPCPRCLTPLADVHKLGMADDMQNRVILARVDDHNRRHLVSAARKLIYQENHQVNSSAVERLLKEKSLVPNTNAFSSRLAPFGFNLYVMLLVDLLHEFELGVWKALFMHLLRILESHDGPNLVAELDRRYRLIPSFGRDSIRRFSTNTSALKNMAARNFENLMQCAIPVFDGLLPEPHNQQISELLFVAAHWHGLAKLRMHNDCTLDVMDNTTVSLGEKLREFSETTCPAFITRELEREVRARSRREAKKAANQKSSAKRSQNGAYRQAAPHFQSADAHPDDQVQPTVEFKEPTTDGQARHLKHFNLNTYKIHSLGDYTATIRKYGTTDSYSTELGELEHRSAKGRYTRTSRKNFVGQLTRIERRQTRIRRIRERYRKAGKPMREDVHPTPDVHHVIGRSQNYPENISLFLQKYADDPAIKDFIPKLKDHLLPRIKTLLSQEIAANAHDNPSQPLVQSPGLEDVAILSADGQAQAAHDSVLFKNDCIYRHHIARFNYTTYDVRRSQDVINPRTSHRDVMLLVSPDDAETNSNHAFLYARVLGIFHTNVIYTGPERLDYASRRLDFLWVRWFRYTGTRPIDWKDFRLDCIQFPPIASDGAFGFVDPRDVLRGCHLIPKFAVGTVHRDGIGLSRCAADSKDWRYYYVNRFADRDMLMRYHRGLAIGHVYSHGHGQTTHFGSPPVMLNGASSMGYPTSDPPCAFVNAAEASRIFNDDESDVDQPELDLRNRDDEEWEDEHGSDCESLGDGDLSDDDILLTMDDMGMVPIPAALDQLESSYHENVL